MSSTSNATVGNKPRRSPVVLFVRGIARIFAAVVVVVAAAACGKTDTHLARHHDVDAAIAIGAKQAKPVLLYFGATWDTAAKELEHVTFADADVRRMLNREFVVVYIDTSDDEDPLTRRLLNRFKVVGDPTILVLASDDGRSELARVNEFVRPDVMMRVLARTRDANRARLERL